jgi:hypothetical protein
MPLTLDAKLDLIETDPDIGQTLNQQPEAEDEYLYQSLGSDFKKYTQMRRDARIRSLLNKRRQAILGRRVIVEAGSLRFEDKLGVERANEILGRLKYESFCSALLNTGQLIGYSVLQLDWKEMEGYVIPQWKFVPQRRFIFAMPTDRDIPTITNEKLDPQTEILMVQGYELRLLTRRSPLYGERCPKSRFVVYTFDADGSPFGLGLGYSLYPWWVVKRESTKNWLMHGDRIGSPPLIGTHPADYRESNPQQAPTLTRFENFLRSVSPNGWAKLPQGFEARVLDALGAAGADVHQSLISLCDSQMSVAVLGEVQYSDKLTGGYAANISQVDDREASLTDSDVNLLDEQLDEQLWTPIADLNYPTVIRPIIRRETIADTRQQALETEKQASLATQANRDATLISQLQLEPSEEYIQETYGKQWSRAPKPQPTPQPTQPQLPELAFINNSEAHDFANQSVRYVYTNGLTIGVEFEVGQERFGKTMQAMYGYISRHIGEDGDALDCYVGPYLDSSRLFRVSQVTPEGEFDEYKYMLCFDTIDRARQSYLAHIPRNRFGGIEEVGFGQLSLHYRPNDPVTPSADQLDDESDYAEISFTIPKQVAANAQRGLALRKQFGRGGTKVGLNTARILAKGGMITPAKARHIATYFPRHEVDKQGENWGNSDNPSNGFIAWLLWGGDQAWSWSSRLCAAIDKNEDK